MSRVRVAVLASGSGTTFENLVVRSRDGRLDADVVALIVSRPDCGAVAKAERLRVPCVVVPWDGDQRAFDEAVTRAVEASRADLVCLGGFLRLWTIPEQWLGRVMNIHPALLPAFGGKGMHGHHVHAAVLAAGAKESGCTVHFATNEYDAGPIIAQRRVPVLPNDTPDSLAARVFAQECEAYPEAISLFAAQRLDVVDGKVEVVPPKPARDDETADCAPRARSRWFRARHEVVWLFLVALAIRAIVAFVNPAIVDDSVTLLRLAARVGHEGVGAVIGSSEHPLVPCLIAWVPRGLDPETAATALSVFAGAFAVWPLHTIARRACGRHAATAASIVYAALPKAVGIASVPHTSAVMLPLLLSGLALAMAAPLGRSKRTELIRLVSSGALCGLAYLCRPEGVVAAFGAAVAALAMARSGRRLISAGIVAGVFVLVATPYAIALSQHAGHFEVSPKKSLAKVVGVDQAPGDADPVADGGAAGDAASAFEGALTAPVFVFVLVGIAVPRRWRRGPARRARLVVLHLAGVFIALLLRVRWGWGYSNARHMLTSGVLLLPFAGEGVHFIGGFISRVVARRRLTIVLASFFAIPCAIRCVTRPEGATRADARALGELIGRQTPGDEPVAVASFAESVVSYYAERARRAPVADLPLWRSFGGTGPGKRLPDVLEDARVRRDALRDLLHESGARWLVLDLFTGGTGDGADAPGRALATALVADGTVRVPVTAAGSQLAAFPVR